MVHPDYRTHIRQARFRRAPLGYRRRDVREHLDRVAGWFSLAGVDEVLDVRMRAAEGEAARIVANARREADAIREAARKDARTVLEEARREAARERSGWSRLGRPVGAR